MKTIAALVLSLSLPLGVCYPQALSFPGPGVKAYHFVTVNADLLYTGNSSTSGTAMTAAIGNSSTVAGTSGGCVVGSGGSFGCNWQTPGTGFTVGAFQSACGANLGAIQVNGGSLFGAGALNFNNIAFGLSNNNQTFEQFFTFGAAENVFNITMGACVYLNTAEFLADYVDSITSFDQGGNFAVAQINYAEDFNGVMNMAFHVHTKVNTASVSPVNIPVTLPGAYLVSLNHNMNSGPGAWGTYASGGTATGPTNSYCNVAVTGGIGWVALSGTNTLSGSLVGMIATSAFGSAPSTGTLSSSNTAVCSGTITITSPILSGAATLCVHSAVNGALIGCSQWPAVAGGAGYYFDNFALGNNENLSQAGTEYFQNVIANWTGTGSGSPPVDIFGVW